MAERDREANAAQRAAWMAAAQGGDGRAYEALLTSLLAPLRAFVRRRGVEDAAVEDVVQEILLLLHRARHTWRAERPFEPWLWAIARNAATDALRRQARERSRRRDAPADVADGCAAEGARASPADPEEGLASRQLSPRLAAALAQLPPNQREAVELLYIEQLGVGEAAARAGTTTGALKVRAHRGSRALRDALGSQEEEA